MAHEGFGYPATDAEGERTAQPERDLQAGDPNLVGAAPKEEKKGIAGRVKGLLGRHGRKKVDTQRPRGVTGKMRDKVEHKIGHGQDGEKHGPARLLSMSSSSSSMSSSDEEDIGTVGFALDPTGPAVAGRSLGRQDFTSAPAGPGADFSDLSLKQDANGASERRHAERAAEFAKESNPMDRKETGSGDARGEHHHSHPIEAGNSNESGREDTGYGGVDGGVDHSPATETSKSNESRGEDAGYGGVEDHSPPIETSNSNESGREDAGYGGVRDRSPPTETRISNESGREDPGYGGLDHSRTATEMSNSNQSGREDAGYGGVDSTEAGNSNLTPSVDESTTNSSGMTNSEGGAVLGDHHGNLNEGPRDDNVKQEGFMSKVMDTFRSPYAGEPAASSTTD